MVDEQEKTEVWEKLLNKDMASTATLIDCNHCKTPYHWQKSSSALKFQFCSFLCEQGELGFTVESIEKAIIKKKQTM